MAGIVLANPVLVDSSGNLLSTNDGSAPAGTAGLMVEGFDGTNARRLNVDSSGRLQVTTISSPPSGVLAGNTDGEITINSAVIFALRKTTYTEQASAAQRSVSSSSASDISAGTGARTVKIVYYDSTMAGPLSETVTLNGVTPVNTVAANIQFIERIEVASAGSNASNVGTISLFVSTGGGGGTIGSIAIGDNVTLWAHHYVQNAKVLAIGSIIVGVKGNTSATVFGKAINPLVSASAEVRRIPSLRLGAPNNNSTVLPFSIPNVVTGPARFTLYGLADGGGASTFFGGFSWTEQ